MVYLTILWLIIAVVVSSSIMFTMYSTQKIPLTHKVVDPEWKNNFITSIQPQMKKVASSLGMNVKYINNALSEIEEVGPDSLSGSIRAPNLLNRIFLHTVSDIYTRNMSVSTLSRSTSRTTIIQAPMIGSHRSNGNAVLASCADGCDDKAYMTFVGSLRKVGFAGDIVIIMPPNIASVPGRLSSYLVKNGVVAYANPISCSNVFRCQYGVEFVS